MGRSNGDSAHDWLNALLTTVASAFLSSLPFVTMVESTDLRQFNHSSHSWRLDRSRNRSIFGQTQVSSRSFVIIEVSAENAQQPALVEAYNDQRTFSLARTAGVSAVRESLEARAFEAEEELEEIQQAQLRNALCGLEAGR